MSQCLFKHCNKNKIKQCKFPNKQEALPLLLNRLKVIYEDDMLYKNCYVCSDHFRALMENCHLKELPSGILPNVTDAANPDSYDIDLSNDNSFILDHSFHGVDCSSDAKCHCLTDGKAKKIAQNPFFSVPSTKYRNQPIGLIPRRLLFDEEVTKDDEPVNQLNGQQSWINKRKKLGEENSRNFKRSKSGRFDDCSTNVDSFKSDGNEIEIFDEEQVDNTKTYNQISQESETEQKYQTNRTSRIKFSAFRQFNQEKSKISLSFVTTTADVHTEPNEKFQISSSLIKFQDEIKKTTADMRNVSKRFRDETAMCTSTNKRTFSNR